MERLKQIRKHSFIQEVSLEFKCLLYSKHCSRGKDIAMKKTKSHFHGTYDRMENGVIKTQEYSNI